MVQWTSRIMDTLLLLQQIGNNLGPVQETEVAHHSVYCALICRAVKELHVLFSGMLRLYMLYSKLDFVPVKH